MSAFLRTRDVADRSRDQRAFGAVQRAQHQFDRKLAAILALRGQFDAGADLLGQRVFLGAQIVGDQPLGKTFRNDVGDSLAQQFVAAITELLFRLQVEKNDLAALVHHHHRVRRRFQQAAVFAFHLRQYFFGIPAHADIADRGRDQRSFRALQRTQHDLDRKFAAVLAQGVELDPGADPLRQRVFGGAQIVGHQPFRKPFRNDVGDFLAQQFVAAVTELLLGLDVEQHDLAALVHHHHRIRRGLHQAAILGAGFRALGEVAADDGEAAQASRGVVRCRIGGARLITRAVLAQLRALFFMFAICCGKPEHLLRLAQRDVLRRKETRKILAGDLLEGTARHSFRARIPAAYLAERPQHQDRVVLDAVDQRSVFAFAFPQRALCGAPPDDVSMNAPARRPGNQEAQNNSDEQDGFGLVQGPRGFGLARCQQSHLFGTHFADGRLKLIHELLAVSASNGCGGRGQAVGSGQVQDLPGEFDLPVSRRLKAWKSALLAGIIGR